MSGAGLLTVSPRLAASWDIPPAETLTLKAGSRTASARLRVAENRGGKDWQISGELQRKLLLHTNNLLLRWDGERETVHLGPNVGIFSSFLPAYGHYEPTSVRAELLYLSRIAQRLPGQFYVFTPGSINWENASVRGHVFQSGPSGGGHWQSGVYPLPEVIYDRITSRVDENKTPIKALKQRLWSIEGLHYFNPFYLSKWQVWEYLAPNPSLRPYLPETELLTRDNLSAMLARHRCVYLKPSHGSLGLGIIRLERGAGQGLRYVVYRSGIHPGRAASVSDFLSRTHGSRRQMTYIVQQGIELARLGNSVFDLRVILQKDRQGHWQMTKKVARIAPAGSQVSNLRRGGRAMSGDRLLRSIFHNDKIAMAEKKQELKDLCLMIAAAIERATGRIFGELGLDIGIDDQRRWWLIEVNSKPRKTTATEASQRVMRQSFLRPLEYATWLAGF